MTCALLHPLGSGCKAEALSYLVKVFVLSMVIPPVQPPPSPDLPGCAWGGAGLGGGGEGVSWTMGKGQPGRPWGSAPGAPGSGLTGQGLWLGPFL